MAAKLKLKRVGTKNRPYYRVVVQDEASSTSGKVVDVLGKYHPLEEPTRFEIDREKTLEWIKKGAEPTEKLRILLGKAGVLPTVDLAALPKRKPKGETPAEAPAAAAGGQEEKPAEAAPIKEEQK